MCVYRQEGGSRAIWDISLIPGDPLCRLAKACEEGGPEMPTASWDFIHVGGIIPGWPLLDDQGHSQVVSS